MPFVNQRREVRKEQPVDPVLEREIARLAQPYRQAMRELAAVVAEARRQTQNSPDPMRSFQQVLTDEVVRSLQNAIKPIADATRRQVIRDGLSGMRSLPRSIALQMTFDKFDPRAVAWAQEQAGRMIVQITDEQVRFVQNVISRSLSQGIPVQGAVEQIKLGIGLHDRWQRAVENSFQRDVESQIANGVNIRQANAFAQERAVIYRSRLIRARALNIARTEINAAQNYGTYISWLQAADQNLLNLSLTKKEWVAGPSGWRGIQVCDICAPLDGKRVPVTASFPNGLITPPAHPSCRCRMILIPPEVPNA